MNRKQLKNHLTEEHSVDISLEIRDRYKWPTSMLEHGILKAVHDHIHKSKHGPVTGND